MNCGAGHLSLDMILCIVRKKGGWNIIVIAV